jgi:hypothetical protein
VVREEEGQVEEGQAYVNDVRTARELCIDTFDEIIDGWVERLLVDEIVRAEDMNKIARLLPQELEFLHEGHGLDMRGVDPMEHDLEDRDISFQHSVV